MAWWGVALAWKGAGRLGALDGLPGEALRLFPRGYRTSSLVLVVLGMGLWGLSAWVKPIALPSGALLVLVPLLGGRRVWPVFGLGLLLGVGLASPFLGPFLRPRPALGLLGSWWWPGLPQTLREWIHWPGGGAARLLEVQEASSFWLFLPLLLMAFFGGFSVGWRRRERAALLAVGILSLVVVAAVLGERLRARYLVSSLLAWFILAGLATVPLRYRAVLPAPRLPPTRRLNFLETLPLSILMTVLVVGNLRFWEAMNLLRVEEEGAAPPRSWLVGWTYTLRPVEDYQDASICGALELERWTEDLRTSLPQGGTLALVPLRDGRSWNLVGPLSVSRPDLALVELDGSCCPLEPQVCAERLVPALSASGGALVVPLSPTDRCQTGAVPQDREPLRRALLPLVQEEGLWYGLARVPAVAGSGGGGLCEALGGRSPRNPARP